MVQIDPDALPEDTVTLQRMLRTVLLQQGELAAENDKMRLLIKRLTRHQFGRRRQEGDDALHGTRLRRGAAIRI